MALKDLVAKVVSSPPSQGKQRVSAFIGAVVADAASLPLEWIYDEDEMKRIVGDKTAEFWPESKCPFFTLPTGSLSCYGDEMVTSLSTLAAGSEPDLKALTESLQKKFGDPESPYQISLANRSKKVYPVAGPWINSGMIKFLANSKDGVQPPGSESCEDNDGLAVSLPTILGQAQQAQDVCKMLTTNAMALDHWTTQSAILGGYLDNAADPIAAAQAKASADVAREIDDVRKAVESGKPLPEIIDEFGKACSLPGSFKGATAVLLAHSGSYVDAVRGNILCGGDCNARAIFVGACLGAKNGIGDIPYEWIEKVNGAEEILQTAIKVYLQ